MARSQYIYYTHNFDAPTGQTPVIFTVKREAVEYAKTRRYTDVYRTPVLDDGGARVRAVSDNVRVYSAPRDSTRHAP